MITSNRSLSRLAVFLLFLALVLAAPVAEAMTWHQVGGSTSGSGTASNSPNAFSFTDQTGVAGYTLITSNTVVLTGTFNNVTAYCPNCYAIMHNGTQTTGTTATGFNSGDIIALRLRSSDIANTAKTATVTLNGTTSSPWSVTTSSDCTASFGITCTDGSIFVGQYANNNTANMYAMPCDLGQSGTKNNCTGTATTYAWGPTDVTTGTTSATDGKTNTATLVALGTSYAAATACKDQTFGGHNDWYLPAQSEAATAASIDYSNGVLAGFYLNANRWVSTEVSSTNTYTFVARSVNSLTKTGTFLVRCVRHD